MSDLAATNCGCDRCENDCDRGNNWGFLGGNNCSCIIWLLVLSCIFGNGGWGCGGNNCGGNGGWGCGGDNSCLILLILLFCCGNN